MEYRRFGNQIVARLDPGDEICSSVLTLAQKENITLASLTAIGATDDFTIGVFDLELQDYHRFSYTGNHEITCLAGNLCLKDGKPYAHLHINCAGKDGNVVGGHLMRAKISLTCEIFLQLSEGSINRRFNPSIGINQFSF